MLNGNCFSMEQTRSWAEFHLFYPTFSLCADELFGDLGYDISICFGTDDFCPERLEDFAKRPDVALRDPQLFHQSFQNHLDLRF